MTMTVEKVQAETCSVAGMTGIPVSVEGKSETVFFTTKETQWRKEGDFYIPPLESFMNELFDTVIPSASQSAMEELTIISPIENGLNSSEVLPLLEKQLMSDYRYINVVNALKKAGIKVFVHAYSVSGDVYEREGVVLLPTGILPFYKGRAVPNLTKSYIFFNLHKHLFSVRAAEGEYKGKVILHLPTVSLAGPVTFSVSEAGRQRVLLEKSKNVHAGLIGYLDLYGDFKIDCDLPITYDPYKYSSFVERATSNPVIMAQQAWLSDKKVFIKSL